MRRSFIGGFLLQGEALNTTPYAQPRARCAQDMDAVHIRSHADVKTKPTNDAIVGMATREDPLLAVARKQECPFSSGAVRAPLPHGAQDGGHLPIQYPINNFQKEGEP